MLNQAKNDDGSIHRHPERVKRVEGSQSIFLVGIKGVAMTNLALILKKMGNEVTGSDLAEKFITDDLLKKNKITWRQGFDPKKLPLNTDLVIYSAAHLGDKNPQIVKAKKRGIKVISQAELLGQLSKQFKNTIAVCGCHGKTTTSSLLAYTLLKLGANPSYMVGSSSFNKYPGGDYNGNEYFIVEADEYGVNPPQDKTVKFHLLNPDYILCTNIDFDHPDIYENINAVKKSFLKFFSKNVSINRPVLSQVEGLIDTSMNFCADDKNLMSVAKKLPRKSYLTYGYSSFADLRIIKYQVGIEGSSFQLQFKKNRHSGLSRIDSGVASFPRMTIKLLGEKNISNTVGVILTLLTLGFDPEKIKLAIKDFTGAKRRFEKVYSENSTFLFDDYAHHPNEIKATISAARSRFPKRRIVIIFQPHTYSRTQVLLKDFAESLSLADIALILPIFPSARENPKNYNTTSRDIAKFNPNKLIYINSKSPTRRFT